MLWALIVWAGCYISECSEIHLEGHTHQNPTGLMGTDLLTWGHGHSKNKKTLSF